MIPQALDGFATRTIGSLEVDDIDVPTTHALVRGWIRDPAARRRVVTPNIDYVAKAERHAAFRDAINGADLRVPDGMWIVYASRLAGRPLRATVTGRLLIPALARIAAQDGLPVGLFGAGPGVAAAAAAALRRDIQGLRVTHAISPPMGLVIGDAQDAAAVDAISKDPPALLFVGLGAPNQELWMAEHASRLGVRVMVGIGAGLDIVAGRFRTAPRWMTGIGLEWAFRLAQEPRRLARRYLVDDPRVLAWAVRTRLGGPR